MKSFKNHTGVKKIRKSIFEVIITVSNYSIGNMYIALCLIIFLSALNYLNEHCF